MNKPKLENNYFDEAKLIIAKKKYETLLLELDKSHRNCNAEMAVNELLLNTLAEEIALLESKIFDKRMKFAKDTENYEEELRKERNKSYRDDY